MNSNAHAIVLMVLLIAGAAEAHVRCNSLFVMRSPLNRVERNRMWQEVKGHYFIERENGSLLNNEQSVQLSKLIALALPDGFIQEQSLVNIEIRSDSPVSKLGKTPSGKVMESALLLDGHLSVQKDPISSFLFISLSESLFSNLQSNPSLLSPRSLGPVFDEKILSTGVFNPSWKTLWKGRRFYVGGLISLSAEPPEAFFAASTTAELKQNDYLIADARAADTWIIRAPDAREESYFKFHYPSPDRPQDTDRSKKFLIAVGSGPAHNPGVRGAAEANLIWLGDEQQGVLTSYLKDISGPQVSWHDLQKHSGFIQRLSPSSYWIGRIDTSNGLTKEGFSSQATDPEIYRRIISPEYDQYLSTLFEDSKMTRSDESYLLATSRGCTQGCAICCSGGLSAFQYFTATRMMTELEKIQRHSRVKLGNSIDIFFVDSNFNNNANRIIEFAKLLEESPMRNQFRFFVRHNTVNGFLMPEKNGFKSPNLDLIRAYKSLGISEVMMGIDAVDNASVMTLKSSRIRLAKVGASTRPIYTYEELQALIQAFESLEIRTRGFLLTNNPWVSDLDRMDSYYNLLQLWLRNPHFSIDMRSRDVIQLKPLDGSPVGDAAKRSDRQIVSGNRFKTDGPFGELDERFDFSPFNEMQSRGHTEKALHAFRLAVNRIREMATSLFESSNQDPKIQQQARWMIQKIIQRDATLIESLSQIRNSKIAHRILQDIKAFQIRHAKISPFDQTEQKLILEEVSRSLIESLRQDYGP